MLGLGSGAARAIAAGLAVVLLAAAWRARSRPRLGEEGAFALTLIACLVASPIVWTDYHMLLILPVILLAPRPSLLWAVPVIAWLYAGNNGTLPTWKIALANIVLAVVAAAALGAAVRLRRPAA